MLELTAHLSRFATVPSHLLAGHAANFQFWADEVAHGLALLDGYEERYQRMLDTQRARLSADMDAESRPSQPFIPPRLVPRPGRMAHQMCNYIRSELCDAFRGFAINAYRRASLDGDLLRSTCQRLSIQVDDSELE